MADNTPNEGTTPPVDEFRAGIRKALALGDDADDAAVLSALGTVTTQRNEAVASAAKITTERNAEKIDAAIQAALSKSGIIPHNTEDATTILRGVLEVTDKGVVTKAAPNVVPGQSAEQFVMGQLKTMRTHYWPGNVSGGARGGSNGAPPGVDVSCFRPGGRLTDQYAVVAAHGERAVIDACRRQAIPVPRWIGGRR